jgi:hypothetical protein
MGTSLLNVEVCTLLPALSKLLQSRKVLSMIDHLDANGVAVLHGCLSAYLLLVFMDGQAASGRAQETITQSNMMHMTALPRGVLPWSHRNCADVTCQGCQSVGPLQCAYLT